MLVRRMTYAESLRLTVGRTNRRIESLARSALLATCQCRRVADIWMTSRDSGRRVPGMTPFHLAREVVVMVMTAAAEVMVVAVAGMARWQPWRS